jgi:hypothetical protein
MGARYLIIVATLMLCAGALIAAVEFQVVHANGIALGKRLQVR